MLTELTTDLINRFLNQKHPTPIYTRTRTREGGGGGG